jgi:hypothetical protein
MPSDKTPKQRRAHVSEAAITESIRKARAHYTFRLKEKGKGTFASRHEVLGSVTEEYHELIEAIHAANAEGLGPVEHELLDLAVACLFGIACIHDRKLDW